jgi:hypothetical protein
MSLRESRGDSIKPLVESVKILSQGAVDGAAAFLGRICLPAAEEFGLLLRDRVSGWRAANATRMAQKAEEMLRESGRIGQHAHPRLAVEIVEKGSWAEEDILQSSWAGLLASSCTEDGKDDSNVLFASLLEQLTGAQVRVLAHSCETSKKYASKGGWIQGGEVKVDLDQLCQIAGVSNLHRLDRELDHLRTIGLIGSSLGGGFHPEMPIADITPSPLSLNLYVRCQGYIGSPIDYWGIAELAPTAVQLDSLDGAR